MEQKIIQITSGKGPAECERVVAKVLEKILKHARTAELETTMVESVKGNIAGTLLSAMVMLKGKGTNLFCTQWEGSVQWIAQSPYRKYHKRKNWFVGVIVHDITKQMEWNDKDVVYQTMRASGPGGQHVNKTESAVRATHLPSGISVTASAERSQLMNKKEATERLKNKLISWKLEQANEKIQDQWMEHNLLLRGNPVKVFKEVL
ncbi:MAG: peptide chain release factor H [Bacteroidetes bacterium]|nr:peptide chain release factor H [Bacteroidota bacterium]